VLEATNLDGFVINIIFVPFKLGWRMDRSTNASVGILMEDSNDFSMLCVNNTTHSCYGDVYHLVVVDALDIHTTVSLVDNTDI